MPQTSRRLYPRQIRRLGVRFWREGEDRPRQGFTKNVSLTGAFVSTPDPAGRGERLRLELSDGGRTVQVYAVVVHAHRVPPELRRFADSAMGLRFLGLDEVVGPFLGDEAQRPISTGEPGEGRLGGTAASPAAGGGVRSAGTGAFRTGGAEGRSDAGTGSSPTAGAGPRLGGDGRAGGGTGGVRPEDGRPSGGETTASLPSGVRPAGGGAGTSPASETGTGALPRPAGGPVATYALTFATGDDFLATYRRDLANGGLFVTTGRPARLHERVAVDLRLPGAGAPTVRIEGRVVQVVEPRPLASGRTAGGMGLEVIDPDAVLRRLAPHVAAFER